MKSDSIVRGLYGLSDFTRYRKNPKNYRICLKSDSGSPSRLCQPHPKPLHLSYHFLPRPPWPHPTDSDSEGHSPRRPLSPLLFDFAVEPLNRWIEHDGLGYPITKTDTIASI